MNVLSEEVKISVAIAPADGAAGTTDINGTTLDMQGYDGVLVLVTFGTITTDAVTSIKMQSGAESDLSDAADLEGTGQTIADDDDEETFYIDLVRPAERYVRLVVDRGTQNAVVAAATYIQYKARAVDVASHGSDVSGEAHVRPDEGTA